MNSVTSRRYARPYRPRLIKAVNAIGRAAGRIGLRTKIEERALIATGRKMSGLEVFRDQDFRVPLRRLLASIESEARLSPVGRIMLAQILSRHLAGRLRIEALCDRQPEIEEIEVRAPVFIVGLQRTGTTILQRLLSVHPNLRALKAWEGVNPAPLGAWPIPEGTREARIPLARFAERAVRYMAPDFFAIHPIIAEGNDEDSLAFDPSFYTTTAEALMNIPSYTKWLQETDYAPAYREYRRVVQLLLWQRPGRWLGKTPLHLEHLGELLDIFPDAKILHTHRDPEETVPSLCSMLAHGRGFFSDQVDPHEVGRQWIAKAEHMVKCGPAARERAGEVAFLDIRYEDTVQDPMKEVHRICDFAGLELTSDTEATMQAFLNSHPQHEYGRHDYSLADFGLDSADVERAFGDYRRRFGLGTH